MVGVKKMLAVVLGLSMLAGVAHGFVVENRDGPDSAWQFAVNGGVPNEPVLADVHDEGRLVDGLNEFQVNGIGSYDASGNQFGGNTFADLPGEQFSTNDFNYANQFQEQQGQFDTPSASSVDAAYVYNARLQSSGVSGVKGEPVNDAAYDYNRVSTLAQGSDAAGSQFDGESSFASYALGDPLQREQEARPDYVYDARAGGSGEDGGASFTTTGVQQQSSGDQVVAVKGHQGPVSIYTPASDRNGAFLFYDVRSDEQKKASDDSAVAASFATSDTATSASTSSILAAQQNRQGTHGCPNS
jgi:hypothetical protein